MDLPYRSADYKRGSLDASSLFTEKYLEEPFSEGQQRALPVLYLSQRTSTLSAPTPQAAEGKASKKK